MPVLLELYRHTYACITESYRHTYACLTESYRHTYACITRVAQAYVCLYNRVRTGLGQLGPTDYHIFTTRNEGNLFQISSYDRVVTHCH